MKINISSKKTVVFLFFTIILLTGIFVYKDYGLTIDDEYYRKNGFFYKEFITKYIYHLFNLDFLKDCEEVFLTGTAVEITPVASIDNYNFRVGETTKFLIENFKKLVIL